jgi:hypothetical protein
LLLDQVTCAENLEKTELAIAEAHADVYDNSKKGGVGA